MEEEAAFANLCSDPGKGFQGSKLTGTSLPGISFDDFSSAVLQGGGGGGKLQAGPKVTRKQIYLIFPKLLGTL